MMSISNLSNSSFTSSSALTSFNEIIYKIYDLLSRSGKEKSNRYKKFLESLALIEANMPDEIIKKGNEEIDNYCLKRLNKIHHPLYDQLGVYTNQPKDEVEYIERVLECIEPNDLLHNVEIFDLENILFKAETVMLPKNRVIHN